MPGRTRRVLTRIRILLSACLGSVEADRRGVTAVEFALVSPMLLLILAGVVDMSRFLWIRAELAQSVRAGIQYGVVNPDDYASMGTVMASATTLNGDASFSVSSSQCSCAATTSTALVWTPCSSTTCAVAPVHEYVLLTANYTYRPLFGRMSFLPSAMSSSVVLRTQ